MAQRKATVERLGTFSDGVIASLPTARQSTLPHCPRALSHCDAPVVEASALELRVGVLRSASLCEAGAFRCLTQRDEPYC
jgi:hypothetical protein